MILVKHRTMTSHTNGHFPSNLPILNGNTYDNWCKQMKVVFCNQDVWDLVKNGVTPIGENAMDEQKAAHKYCQNKYDKFFFIINQYVDPYTFEKVGDVYS